VNNFKKKDLLHKYNHGKLKGVEEMLPLGCLPSGEVRGSHSSSPEVMNKRNEENEVFLESPHFLF
jgi:hypothetical protein